VPGDHHAGAGRALTGPIDTIVAHFDLDGLYAAAKWILGGREPYPGADDDARAVDTRIGEVSPRAQLIDKALRVHYDDAVLKQRIVHWLCRGLKPGGRAGRDRRGGGGLRSAQAEQARDARRALRDRRTTSRCCTVPRTGRRPFDKTELLLARPAAGAGRDRRRRDDGQHRGGVRERAELRDAARARRRDADAGERPGVAAKRCTGEDPRGAARALRGLSRGHAVAHSRGRWCIDAPSMASDEGGARIDERADARARAPDREGVSRGGRAAYAAPGFDAVAS
jgi:hypothetical protein